MKGLRVVLLPVLLTFVSWANASVVINGTRVIYPQNEKEVTVKLTNNGKSPVLVQSWLDNGNIDESPDTIRVPFVLTPPINRIDPEKSQTLRITFTGTGLPDNKESVYWLNVLEIPRTKADAPRNRLQFAFRSRIKMFYRPAALTDDPSKAAKSLKWSFSQGKLKADNRSGFFVSLLSVTVEHAGKKNTIEADMIAPFTSHSFSVSDASAGDIVSWEYINDWGAVKTGTSTLF